MENGVVRVGDVMQTSLHMINGLDSVTRALAEMRRHSVSSLVIERRDGDDEYGVVSVRDIAEKVVAENHSAERTSVYQVMTKPALTVSAGMSIKYAIRLLARLDAGRALVMGPEGLSGLVTLRDMVIRYAGPEREPILIEGGD